jgi:hypothetical protein
MRKIKAVFGIVAPALLVCLGCGGGDVGYVEGTVTMDGAPLPDAIVTFQPEGGRPSSGRTDENGYYELIYTRGKKGAIPGKHTVTISTLQEGDPDAGGESVPEKVPAKYNTDTELTADVKAGRNDFDFDLSSEGEIVVEAESSGEATPGE